MQIGLAALLVIGCLPILRPFVPLIMWGIIIAIASYPTFTKFEKVLKGRRALAAVDSGAGDSSCPWCCWDKVWCRE